MITKVTYCPHCGQLVPDDELYAVNVDGTIEEWCTDCLDRDAFYCERCGQYHNGEPITVHQGMFAVAQWCESCAETHATICDCCGRCEDNDSINTVYIYQVGYQDICPTCLEEGYYQCSKCGDYCLEDDIEYRDGSYYCPGCVPCYVDDYHHTEGENFLNTVHDRNQPYLGVELEMEFETDSDLNNAAEYIRTNTRFGSYYDCKTDSSLGDYGMECVTQPATPAYHMAEYDAVMLSAGHIYHATSHDNGSCGLHVHVDRAYFNDTGIQEADVKAGFIMDTVFSNNELYIVNFTRRRYSQLNHWAQFLNMRASKEIRTLSGKLTEYRSAKYVRYQAVNMSNYDTIELRLFRGTLNTETYYATLEFVSALAYLTRALLPIPEYAETLTWDDLKTELFAALDLMNLSSTELSAYLKRRGI